MKWYLVSGLDYFDGTSLIPMMFSRLSNGVNSRTGPSLIYTVPPPISALQFLR